MKCIRILVADGQEMFCESIAARLGREEDMMIIGWCTSEAELLDQADLFGPDAVVLGLPLGAALPGDVVRGLRQRAGGAVLVVLPEAEEGHGLLRLLEAGADAVVPRSAPVAELVSTIRAGLRGETRIGPAVARKLAEGLAEEGFEELLTPAEREVLVLAAEGLPNAEIAARVYASVSTAKRRLSSAFAKLGAATRHEAIDKARARGIIS